MPENPQIPLAASVKMFRSWENRWVRRKAEPCFSRAEFIFVSETEAGDDLRPQVPRLLQVGKLTFPAQGFADLLEPVLLKRSMEQALQLPPTSCAHVVPA